MKMDTAIRAGSSRDNLFDILRLLAALAVLVSHAFVIAGRPQPEFGSFAVSTIGVTVFFAISGYLITQSWSFDPNIRRYLAKRALRIMPALIVVVILTTFVIGPLFTSVSIRSYFAGDGTWLYLMTNSLLLHTDSLPGVFDSTLGDARVNASLWTLKVEALAYLGVIGVGLAGGFKRRWVPPVVAAVVFVAPHVFGIFAAAPPEMFVVRAFAVGACLYVFRTSVPWRWSLAALSVFVWWAAPTVLQPAIAPVVIAYVALLFGFGGPAVLRRLTAHGDFSYGIYLFAWPAGQAVATLWGASATPALVIGLSLPITFVLAVLSWKLIEQPALGLKKYLVGHSTEPRVDSPPAIVPGIVSAQETG